MTMEATLKIRMSAETYDWLKAKAAELDRSAAWVARQALEVYIASLVEQEKGSA